MALPAVKTFADNVDWSKTVSPFLPQLYELPSQLVSCGFNIQAIKAVYIATNPLVSAFAFCLALSPIFLVTAEINRNWSQVDRCWSILPTIYNLHYVIYAHMAGVPTKRLDTLAFFSIMWSARLTFNYWRKGGYSIGSEDYRWQIIKEKIGAPLFLLLDIVFICSLQSVLLWLITTPTYIMLVSAKGIGDSTALADVIFSRSLGLLVFAAYLADEQQWRFYNAREEYRKTAKVPAGYFQEDLDRGFNVTGMFSWSRHPNFAAEQAFWIGVYAWVAWITKGLVNWTIAGPLCYMLLFQGSTLVTELISQRKYPEYAEYRRRVGRFLPKLPGGNSGPGDFSDQRKSK